jgi:hypothetical protein
VLPLYITLLARPKTTISQSMEIQADKHVPLKRQIGILRRRILEKFMPGRAWVEE